MPPDEPRAPTSKRRFSVRKLGCSLAIVLVGLWACVEALSRRADVVMERRRADPEWNRTKHEPDLWEKWSYATLDPLQFELARLRVVPHPFLGYALKPGWSSGPGDKQRISINALGLRGKETTWKKPAGVYRIVTLGGSSVFGSQDSRDESVWSARLETKLANAIPGKTVEVLNGGCLGYNSFEMLVSFELRLLNAEPDMVIVYEAINDMKAALYTKSGIAVQPDNTHYRSAWLSERPSDVDAWLESSRLWLIWRRYFTSYGRQKVDLYAYVQKGYGDGGGSWYCDGGQAWPSSSVPEQGLVNYRRNLNSLISVADAAGVKVVLATQALVKRELPPNEECRETQLATFDRIQAIERDVARERGMPLCDCGPKIVAEVERVWNESAQDAEPDPVATDGWRWKKGDDGRWRKDLFHNDVHPYDEGSEVIARTIAEWLLASRLME